MPNKDDFDLDDVDEIENKAMKGADFPINEEETQEHVKYRLNHERRIQEVKRILTLSGWLDNCIDGKPSIDLNVYEPEVLQAAHKWQEAVQAKRQVLIAKKNQNIPKLPDGTATRRKDPFSNNVKIVNKNYLEKFYQISSVKGKTILYRIITDFQLNADQERAFCIVANHASEPQTDPLKMYLGGMGGTGKSRVI